jgi:hypothetical protein
MKISNKSKKLLLNFKNCISAYSLSGDYASNPEEENKAFIEYLEAERELAERIAYLERELKKARR